MSNFSSLCRVGDAAEAICPACRPAQPRPLPIRAKRDLDCAVRLRCQRIQYLTMAPSSRRWGADLRHRQHASARTGRGYCAGSGRGAGDTAPAAPADLGGARMITAAPTGRARCSCTAISTLSGWQGGGILVAARASAGDSLRCCANRLGTNRRAPGDTGRDVTLRQDELDLMWLAITAEPSATIMPACRRSPPWKA
jgi:hypothetical protein